jgi:hypothetical protein
MKPKLADKKSSSSPINNNIRFFLQRTRFATPAIKIKVGMKIAKSGIYLVKLCK